MATCPKCGNKVDVPDKKFQNEYFTIAVYTCSNCGTKFKEDH